MSTLRTNAILDASGGNTATINGMTPTAQSLQGFRNRIINGDMRIDQRNAGASVTPTSILGATYSLDRWATYGSAASKFSVQQNAGSVTPPAGYPNYLGVTSLSSYSVGAGELYYLYQAIEGFNMSDFAFGSASASSVTLSFWVRSSLTGAFSGSLTNGAFSRSYPFTYTINAANTWEQKTVTVAGDTAGSWTTGSGTGMNVFFNLGSGSNNLATAGAWTGAGRVGVTGSQSIVATNGATLYITGVQLEAGSVATPFERRDFGTEFAKCQRYYQTSYPIGVAIQSLTNVTDGASFICINTSDTSNGGPLFVSMRATPEFFVYSSNGGVGANSAREGGGANVTGITLVGGTANNLPRLSKNAGLGTQGAPFTAHWTANAEL